MTIKGYLNRRELTRALIIALLGGATALGAALGTSGRGPWELATAFLCGFLAAGLTEARRLLEQGTPPEQLTGPPPCP